MKKRLKYALLCWALLLLGGGVAVVCLLIFGGSAFMLPALLATSGALVFANRREGTAK